MIEKLRKFENILRTFDFMKVHEATKIPLYKLVLDAKLVLDLAYDQAEKLKDNDIKSLDVGYYTVDYSYNGGDIWLELKYVLSIGHMKMK